MKAYKRIGECNRCGRCCTVMKFEIPDNELVRQLMRVRSLKTFISNYDKKRYVLIPHVCPKLRKGRKCIVHDRKLKVCKIYPKHPLETEGIRCAFNWEEIEDSLGEYVKNQADVRKMEADIAKEEHEKTTKVQ